METREKRVEEYACPEGVEVKVNIEQMYTIIMYEVLVLFIFGGLLFNWIWGGLSEYQGGYGFGKTIRFVLLSSKGVSLIIGCCLIYYMIQYLLLYCFFGKDRRSIRRSYSWKSSGFLLMKPLALKYYRWVLLVPFFVLGVFPMLHGFCVGNLLIYIVGAFCTCACSTDCYYFVKLRSFNAEDKIMDGEKPYSAVIIKSTY
ncbi:metalloprotease family protein [uncultured Parabacteroides sp.]|uniref:metalloprotease family protein n=1 Tax=uncultured Parabacteroides sp. TaxID=512312 RepID=UPI0025FFAAB2|nr:metalloprotease family protein [uncultured Parabacteroides sp.]